MVVVSLFSFEVIYFVLFNPCPVTEFLPISVHFCKRKFVLEFLYRPPSTDIYYFEDFATAVETLDIANFANCILVGDLNIDH